MIKKRTPILRLMIQPRELIAMLPIVRMPSKNQRIALKIELNLWKRITIKLYFPNENLPIDPIFNYPYVAHEWLPNWRTLHSLIRIRWIPFMDTFPPISAFTIFLENRKIITVGLKHTFKILPNLLIFSVVSVFSWSAEPCLKYDTIHDPSHKTYVILESCRAVESKGNQKSQ